MYVDGTRIEFPYTLQPAEEGTDLLPGDGRKRAAREVFLDPLDIGLQIGNIGGDSAGSKVAERKDVFVFFNKRDVRFKHDEALL